MRIFFTLWFCFAAFAAEDLKLPADPGQILERTCFQTGGAYSDSADLRSDVAIVYGIDPKLNGVLVASVAQEGLVRERRKT